MNPKTNRRKSGFTLVEVILAMAILAIIAILMTPVLSSAYIQIAFVGKMVKDEKAAVSKVEGLLSQNILAQSPNATFVIPGGYEVNAQKYGFDSQVYGDAEVNMDIYIPQRVPAPSVDEPNVIFNLGIDYVTYSNSKIVIKFFDDGFVDYLKYAIDDSTFYDDPDTKGALLTKTISFTITNYNASHVLYLVDSHDIAQKRTISIQAPPYQVTAIKTGTGSNAKYIFSANGINLDKVLYATSKTSSAYPAASGSELQYSASIGYYIKYDNKNPYIWLRMAGEDKENIADSIFVRTSITG